METNWNNTERRSATIGKAGPIETKEPVAMADVAEPPGPVGVRAGGPVVAGTQFTAVTDRTGASGLGRRETGEPVVAETRIQAEIAVAEAGGPAGTGAGSPVMVGNQFLAVADVQAWLENREDDPQSDLGKFELVTGTISLYQLDLRTGQLWADGRSTLQLHQQKPTPTVSGSLMTAVVLPPDSDVVANFSIDGGHEERAFQNKGVRSVLNLQVNSSKRWILTRNVCH